MSDQNKGPGRWIILGVVILAAVGAFMLRGGQDQDMAEAVVRHDSPLPVLLDLGADKCVPCKMMVPVLDELEKGLAGKLDVKFLDVWKNPDEAKKYAIKLIPTQIFLDAKGKELFRHEGFFARDDILAKWRELGFEFTLQVPEKG